jgi:hypothetical protein
VCTNAVDHRDRWHRRPNSDIYLAPKGSNLSKFATGFKKMALTTLVLATGMSLVATFITAGAASAFSPNPLTISASGTASPALSGPQASTKVFQTNFPSGAKCPGNTATNGYHLYSYVVPTSVDPGNSAQINFAAGSPSTGWGYFDTGGNYYSVGGGSTDSAGAPSGVPTNFAFQNMVTTLGLSAATLTGGSSALYHTGFVCTDSSGNPVSDSFVWNCDVTFTAVTAAVDANGYQWTPCAQGTTNVPEAPLALALPIGGAAVLFFGVMVNRRRARPVAGPAAA